MTTRGNSRADKSDKKSLIVTWFQGITLIHIFIKILTTRVIKLSAWIARKKFIIPQEEIIIFRFFMFSLKAKAIAIINHIQFFGRRYLRLDKKEARKLRRYFFFRIDPKLNCHNAHAKVLLNCELRRNYWTTWIQILTIHFGLGEAIKVLLIRIKILRFHLPNGSSTQFHLNGHF